MGWLWLVGSKKYVSFAKEPYKRDYVLQKRPISLRSLLMVGTWYLKRNLLLVYTPRVLFQLQLAAHVSRCALFGVCGAKGCSLLCATWLIHMCVSWLIFTCDMTRTLYTDMKECHVMCDLPPVCWCVLIYMYNRCVDVCWFICTILVWMCVYSHVWQLCWFVCVVWLDSFLSGTWLIYTFATIVVLICVDAYVGQVCRWMCVVWHDSFLCVTWLTK